MCVEVDQEAQQMCSMPYENSPTTYSLPSYSRKLRRKYQSLKSLPYSRLEARFLWKPDQAATHRLRMAVTTNNVELVEQLLGCGLDPNSSDKHRRSLLHLAACQGYLDIVKLLLIRGADPNNRDSLGNTPLHLAVCTNHVPVVIELLSAGTDVSSLNRHGLNPVQLAQSKLKLFQLRPCSNPVDREKLKKEISDVVDMMLKYLSVQNKHIPEIEALRQRMDKLDTKEQIDTEVSLLLSNLGNLSLSK